MKAGHTTTRLASAIPPVKRVYQALTTLNEAVRELQTARGKTNADLQQLRGRLDKIETEQTGAPEPPTQAAPNDEAVAIDAATRRELGEAALRHVPFLPGNLAVLDDQITVEGICGAPDGLTKEMAFFLNGRRIADVDYPIVDRALEARFPEMPGKWFYFRVRVREDIEARLAETFWRFDAAPLGHYADAAWRQAFHFMNPARERFAFPPAVRMLRVIGDDSTARFGMGGATIFNNAARLLSEIGYGWDDFPQILDWGCGCGRLTRYLVGETRSAVTGIDIDADNIAWCRETYTNATFHSVPLRPPTELATGQFDLVFGISVLTHLSEADQDLWLDELRRITRPGSILLLSIQGPAQFAINGFPPSIFRRIQAEGYLNLQRDSALDDVVSEKDYYRSAMHSRAYITAHWSRYFDVLGFADGVAALQDFVILRRPA